MVRVGSVKPWKWLENGKLAACVVAFCACVAGCDAGRELPSTVLPASQPDADGIYHVYPGQDIQAAFTIPDLLENRLHLVIILVVALNSDRSPPQRTHLLASEDYSSLAQGVFRCPWSANVPSFSTTVPQRFQSR